MVDTCALEINKLLLLLRTKLKRQCFILLPSQLNLLITNHFFSLVKIHIALLFLLQVNLKKPQIPRALIGQIERGKVKSLQAKLTIIGGQLGGRCDDFQSSEMITIQIPKISLFIQTDKPIYKPGQTGNKTNHLYSFMDGSLKAETCISQSITSQLESCNWTLATSQQFTEFNHAVEFNFDGLASTSYSVVVGFESYITHDMENDFNRALFLICWAL